MEVLNQLSFKKVAECETESRGRKHPRQSWSLNLGLAAHIHLEGLGDFDGAVGLEIIFQESNEHTGRRNYGVIQGMGKIIAVFSLNADA